MWREFHGHEIQSWVEFHSWPWNSAISWPAMAEFHGHEWNSSHDWISGFQGGHVRSIILKTLSTTTNLSVAPSKKGKSWRNIQHGLPGQYHSKICPSQNLWKHRFSFWPQIRWGGRDHQPWWWGNPSRIRSFTQQSTNPQTQQQGGSACSLGRDCRIPLNKNYFCSSSSSF